jgi:hypothetical protein
VAWCCHSTHNPPHKQLLMRLGVGGASLSFVCHPSLVVIRYWLLVVVDCSLFVCCLPLVIICPLSIVGSHWSSSIISCWSSFVHCPPLVIVCTLSVVGSCLSDIRCWSSFVHHPFISPYLSALQAVACSSRGRGRGVWVWAVSWGFSSLVYVILKD